jgi:hypothetical protein
MVAHRIDLILPASEHALAVSLGGPWRDLLYVPGPDFTSPLDPGSFRSAFVAVPAAGHAVRISSVIAPAFGIELCRLQLEALPAYPGHMLGSFFDPSRRGRVFATSRENSAPESRTGWSYAGPSLGERLSRAGRVRLIRERVSAKLDGQAIGWTADRGLVIDVPEGEPCLLLASAESSEQALFLPVPRLHRALLGSATPVPGATAPELLGYGEWREAFDLALEIVAVGFPELGAC